MCFCVFLDPGAEAGRRTVSPYAIWHSAVTKMRGARLWNQDGSNPACFQTFLLFGSARNLMKDNAGSGEEFAEVTAPP
jgi:hypothetical protein